jgi:hypothetical protein
MRRCVLWARLAVALLLGGTRAASADWFDWNVGPLETGIGNAQFHLGGDASGAVYANDAPSSPGLDSAGATGSLRFFPRIERSYDSGLILGIHGSIVAWRDRLSIDRYGGQTIEKAYGAAETGLGTLELGNTDGAAYRLAVTGPKVDEKVSIDNPEITFFIDPTTHRAFDSLFTVRTEVGSSLNYAKLSYYSPRLFGIQAGASFTPSEGKDVLPFLNNGPHLADRQQNIWDMALSYSGNLGAASVGASAAISLGHDAAKTPGHEGLTEWGLGLAADYPVSDELKLSLGGAYRLSNAYAFNLNDVAGAGSTHALHGSLSASYNSWIAGFEITDGSADESSATPALGIHGYEASAGYVLNSNLQLTLGWQRLVYARDFGTFYNGGKHIGMDAGYLHLDFHV